MTTIFKTLTTITTLLLVAGCTVQYSTKHPMADNPRYKEHYARIAKQRQRKTEIVVRNPSYRAYGAQTASNRPKQEVIDPNSLKALTFGKKQTIYELAKAKGITGRGGIKWGRVVLLPSPDVWDRAMAKSIGGGVQFHIKPIHNGQSIASASRYPSDAGIQLIRGRIPNTGLSTRQKSNQCGVIFDETGEPVVIREGETGFHRYGFRHFIHNDSNAHYEAEKQVKHWQEVFKKEQTALEQLKYSIAKNRAHQNGQCVTVKQRSIPPAPKRIDPALIELNAHGACVNLVGSQFTQEQVVEALEAAGRFDITQNYQKWVLEPKKMSCAVGVTIDEFESTKTRLIDWLAPNLGKDYFRKAIRKDIDSCVYKVKSACDDGYHAWLNNKNDIINEPAKLLKQCQADTSQLKNYDYTALNNAKAQLAKTVSLRDAALQKKKQISEETVIPFTDRRTYCE